MSARARSAGRWLATFALVSLLALLLLARSLPEPTSARAGSALSAQDRGRRALFLLLLELGYDVRVWTGAPAELARASGVVLLGATPETPPGYEPPAARPAAADAPGEPGPEGEERSPEPAAASHEGPPRTRDPLHYRRFVEQGGVLLAAFDEELQAFLAHELGLAPVAELALIDDPAAGRLRALFGAEDDLRLSLSARRRFAPLPLGTPFEVLATDAQGAPRALALALGRGRLCLFTPGEVLENRNLGDADNALFLVRILERLAVSGPLYFDEYALGGWVPDSPLALALSPGRRGFTLQLALALALLLWGAAWVGPFARDPAPAAEVAPRARAQAQAGLLARAGRFDLLGRALQAGVARRLAPGGRAPDPAHGRAPQDAPAQEPEHLRALRPLVVGRLGEAGWEEARTAFSRTVRDEQALEELGRELALWERRLAPAGARSTAG